MRVTMFFYVGNELVCKLTVSKPAIVIFRDAPPRTEMHFIDGYRAAPLVILRARFQIVRIAPGEGLGAGDDGAAVSLRVPS